jgi:hypothetical protein
MYRLKNPHKIAYWRTFENQRRKWILSQITRMAHDDGTWQALKEEYDRNHER